MDTEKGNHSLPRFDLVKSIVAAPPISSVQKNNNTDRSEDDDQPQTEYVTHLERSCDSAQLAAALSSREIKLYSSDTMLQAGKLSGHTGPLTQLAFSPSDVQSIFSASEDGTVRSWDTRSLSCTATFGQSGEEVWSMALGYDGHLCATGKGCTVEFYDLRKAGKPLGTYSECHTDAVTQVRFHPHNHSFMLTGSEDGLMCFFDTGVSSEEDALDSVMNAECAVRTVGFFGPKGEGVYCCTNTETLSLWHAAGAQRIADFGDVRALARGDPPTTSDNRNGGEKSKDGTSWGAPVDCIVGCQYEPEADRLRLVTSGFEGAACLATVVPSGITPDAVLEGAHTEQVRTFDWRGQMVATGGEDAKVCLWRVPGGTGVGGYGGREDSDSSNAMDDDGDGSVAGRGGGGGAAMSGLTAGGRRIDNRAGRAFRPYDTDGRRR